MPSPPRLTLVRIQHGIHPEAGRLNPRFVPGHPLLLATLDIAWDPPDPVRAIAGLERKLLAFSPAFSAHECRGEGQYHVFTGGKEGPARSPRPGAPGRPGPGFEGALALAHLIEHAVIHFQTEVTGASLCSGVTAAHRSLPCRFDLMVESMDPALGGCCLNLALKWITRAFSGRAPGEPERDVLRALRALEKHRDGPVFPTEVSEALGWNTRRTARALRSLQEAGFLEELPRGRASAAAEFRVHPRGGALPEERH